MATSLRYERWAAAVAAPLLLVACGEKEEPAAPRDAGAVPDGALLGGIEGLLAALGDDVAGSPCEGDEDCEGMNALCSPGAPGVIHSCTGLCTRDEHCGSNGSCVEVARLGAETLSFCQRLCERDDDCDSQLQCRPAFNVHALLRSISDLLRGAAVFAGERTPNICQEKPDTVMIEDGAVGRACSEGCPGGRCDALPPSLMPGGYCSGKCSRDEHCGEGGACVQDFATSTLGLPGMCLLRCSNDEDCRHSEGYRCSALPWLHPDTRTYCVPDQLLRGGPPRPMPQGDAGGP